MPEWIRALIENKTGGLRGTRWTRCPKCKATILRGLDDDAAARTVTADPTPLTPETETACLLAGRDTFHALHRGNNTYELNYRDAGKIAYFPPSSDYPVLPAHACGQRLPGHLPNRNHNGNEDDECPF